MVVYTFRTRITIVWQNVCKILACVCQKFYLLITHVCVDNWVYWKRPASACEKFSCSHYSRLSPSSSSGSVYDEGRVHKIVLKCEQLCVCISAFFYLYIWLGRLLQNTQKLVTFRTRITIVCQNASKMLVCARNFICSLLTSVWIIDKTESDLKRPQAFARNFLLLIIHVCVNNCCIKKSFLSLYKFTFNSSFNFCIPLTTFFYKFHFLKLLFF